MAGTARPAGTAIGAGAPEHGRPSARAGRIEAYGGGTRGPAKTLAGGRSDIGGAAYRVGQRPYRGRSRTAAAGVGRFGGATCRGPPGDAGTVARAAAACQPSRYAAGGGAGFVNFKVRDPSGSRRWCPFTERTEASLAFHSAMWVGYGASNEIV